MKRIVIIKTDEAEFGELFDSDYESTGECWHYPLNPNDDESAAVIVGDIFVMVGETKLKYKTTRISIPKRFCAIMSDQEDSLYKMLFE